MQNGVRRIAKYSLADPLAWRKLWYVWLVWVDVGGEGRRAVQLSVRRTPPTVLDCTALYVSRSVSRDLAVNWTGEISPLTERIMLSDNSDIQLSTSTGRVEINNK